MKANNTQKAKIHIAKAELKLDDVAYQGYLAPFGVESSKDLTYKQAEQLLKIFKEQGWKSKLGKGKKKYEEYRGRRGDFAEPQQLRLVEVLWKIVARHPNDEARDTFIFRLTKMPKMHWLTKKHVEAVLCALEDMYRKMTTEEIAARTDKLIPEDKQFLKENLRYIRQIA